MNRTICHNGEQETVMPPLVVLTGPTAVGKTELSIALAKAVNGEIISADSMQVYKGMDIGSAKIHPEEMRGVPHHLIDVLEPVQPFNVVQFQTMAKEAVDRILNNGHLPIVVGGTGFYIQALLYGIDFTETEETAGDGTYRNLLETLAREKGNQVLYDRLVEADPEYAAANHPNNRKRIIRALEYIHLTGQKFSVHNETQRRKTSPYRSAYFVLTMDRSVLYDRINRRIDRMMADGLVEEVRWLYEQGCRPGMTSMQGLGYKEILDYLLGHATLEEAVERLKQNTRHFAKRQLTWFRREPDVIWMERNHDPDQETLLQEMLATLNRKGLI